MSSSATQDRARLIDMELFDIKPVIFCDYASDPRNKT
jgi:hypothetical protein